MFKLCVRPYSLPSPQLQARASVLPHPCLSACTSTKTVAHALRCPSIIPGAPEGLVSHDARIAEDKRRVAQVQKDAVVLRMTKVH